MAEGKKKFVVRFNNNTYDLTNFTSKHPGGIDTLKGLHNSDMTTRFLKAPPHSSSAMYLLNDYKIDSNSNDLNKTLNREENENPSLKSNGIHTNGLIGKNGINLIEGSQNVHRNHGKHSNNNNNNINCNKNITTDSDKCNGSPSESSHNNSDGNMLGDYANNNNNNIELLTDESMEYLVDWSKPMIAQIPHIGEHYDEWVHKPVDRPLRLFGPWYMEMLTKTPWWIVPTVWIPVIIYAAYIDIWNYNISVFTSVLYFIAGILLWTFIEYSTHRWLFHMKVNGTQKTWALVLHFTLHGLHHKVPFDSLRLVFPPIPAAFIASIFYTPISFVVTYCKLLASGALFGYLCYDMMHYYLHHGSPTMIPIYNMKRYHYQHHFVHQDLGFGISSPLWDVVFGTKIYLRKLKYMLRWKL